MKSKKFIICILLFVSLIFTSTTSFAINIVSAQSTQNIGDLNNNGTIDMGDIIQMLRHIAATSKNNNKEWILSEEKQKLADLNKNNNVDIGDIMIALRYWAAKNNKDISKEHPEWLKIDKQAEKQVEKQVEVTSIKLNDTYEELSRGSSFKLEATIKPANASNKTIEWSSSDENVATVSQTGLVMAVGAGKAKITAKTSNGKTANCTIVVKPVYVEELTLNKNEIKLIVEKTEKLEVSISNSHKVDNSAVEWRSSNEKVATVSQTGLVTGIKKGTATITVKAKDGSGKRATCKVTVIQLVTGITFKEKEIILTPGKTRTITKTISPSDASNKDVEWSSSDSSTASVDTKGKVTAHKKGITTITAKAKDGSNVYATCKVEVAQPVTSIKIEKEITLNTGTTKTLKAEITPSIANNKDITWISSNEMVATVSQTGVVKGIKKGTATITVKAKDGSGVYAKCKVNVLQLITQIKLNKTQATMYENDTLKLIPEITPINANNRELKWTSSNANIASVDTYGNVTAKKKGTAIITVTAKDGSNKKATCTITVKERIIEKITISNLTLKVGESRTLIPKIEPENAKNPTLTWKSSNEKVATVTQSGVVKGIKEGTATITAKSSNNITGTCTVKVSNETSSSSGNTSGDTQKLVESLKYGCKFIGKIKYKLGASGKLEHGYSDCSHYVFRVFEHEGVMKKFVKSEKWGYHGCPNTTDVAHFKKGEKWDYSNASPGDVIWEHYGSGSNNHVYIYLGNHKRLGCSSSHGVRIAEAHSSGQTKYERKIIHFDIFPKAPNSYYDPSSKTIKYK